jgi:hypothetical protein
MKLKLNMKTRNLLITLTVTALATINVMAADALLSPRASEHQSKIVPAVITDPNLAAPGLASVSPRLLDNQPKAAVGISTGTSPSAACVRNMAGTPKMISACADHPGAPMSCCSVAGAK